MPPVAMQALNSRVGCGGRATPRPVRRGAVTGQLVAEAPGALRLGCEALLRQDNAGYPVVLGACSARVRGHDHLGELLKRVRTAGRPVPASIERAGELWRWAVIISALGAASSLDHRPGTSLCRLNAPRRATDGHEDNLVGAGGLGGATGNVRFVATESESVIASSTCATGSRPR